MEEKSLHKSVAEYLWRESWELVERIELGTTASILVVERDAALMAAIRESLASRTEIVG